MLFILTLLVTCILIFWLVAERLRLDKSVHKIQVRVHVNGTRGKSTVTRLIAAGLRNSGRVIAKITGVYPTVIFPDGSVKRVRRRGNVRVTEQFKFMSFALRNKANITVLENMSVSPELQQLESKFIRPDIYVITNIRDDHREVLGSSLVTQAGNIISAIPQGTTVFTSDEAFIPLLERKCDEAGSVLKYLMPPPQGVFSQFPAHLQENLNLALNVLQYLHVDAQKALALLIAEAEQINKSEQPVVLADAGLVLVNAMSINDTSSLRLFLNDYESKNGPLQKYAVVLNTRYDRPLRTIQFCDFLASDSRIGHLILTGSHARFARHYLRKKKAAAGAIAIVNFKTSESVPSVLAAAGVPQGTVLMLGNIYGDGFSITENLSSEPAPGWVVL